ncbi:hypothetical protein KKH43_01310 [Patescibacteria group bacterium]|nr:hypothetical protein [Patescibacteria group bacterium]
MSGVDEQQGFEPSHEPEAEPQEKSYKQRIKEQRDAKKRKRQEQKENSTARPERKGATGREVKRARIREKYSVDEAEPTPKQSKKSKKHTLSQKKVTSPTAPENAPLAESPPETLVTEPAKPASPELEVTAPEVPESTQESTIEHTEYGQEIAQKLNTIIGDFEEKASSGALVEPLRKVEASYSAWLDILEIAKEARTKLDEFEKGSPEWYDTADLIMRAKEAMRIYRDDFPAMAEAQILDENFIAPAIPLSIDDPILSRKEQIDTPEDVPDLAEQQEQETPETGEDTETQETEQDSEQSAPEDDLTLSDHYYNQYVNFLSQYERVASDDPLKEQYKIKLEQALHLSREFKHNYYSTFTAEKAKEYLAIRKRYREESKEIDYADSEIVKIKEDITEELDSILYDANDRVERALFIIEDLAPKNQLRIIDTEIEKLVHDRVDVIELSDYPFDLLVHEKCEEVEKALFEGLMIDLYDKKRFIEASLQLQELERAEKITPGEMAVRLLDVGFSEEDALQAIETIPTLTQEQNITLREKMERAKKEAREADKEIETINTDLNNVLTIFEIQGNDYFNSSSVSGVMRRTYDRLFRKNVEKGFGGFGRKDVEAHAEREADPVWKEQYERYTNAINTLFRSGHLDSLEVDVLLHGKQKTTLEDESLPKEVYGETRTPREVTEILENLKSQFQKEIAKLDIEAERNKREYNVNRGLLLASGEKDKTLPEWKM